MDETQKRGGALYWTVHPRTGHSLTKLSRQESSMIIFYTLSLGLNLYTMNLKMLLATRTIESQRQDLQSRPSQFTLPSGFVHYRYPHHTRQPTTVLLFTTSIIIVIFTSSSPSSSQNPALIILPLPLTPGPNLFTRQIPRSLQQSTLPKLSPHSIVHPILDPVDVLVAGDFRFREVVC